ncbi:FxDxF family PEP-CTERM protein [Nitrosomonas oligotropha]|uniref:PEP-CTERM protein-sorting domain-containing protein n=1 Tax=Nitrosomonas oligotropha TaxID=42354 RepID=A0A1H8LPG1_9PROT|nr:FxDxF family PEP-CTERM protein [Nitrosomonas oligotropha]SDW41736.1 PEP-CTERM protein-sorting domain-containing protein [Nitrosomonas oligotropha]SEO06738.1 PEP-CTERM protein-sorting domain-containing protein [Nitrosomonas oligotropha]
MRHSLNYALVLAGLVAGFVSVPVKAHIFTHDFGVFDGSTGATATILSGVSGNYGWIDGTDADWGDTHKLSVYQFTLTGAADVQLSFEQAVALGGRNGLNPGFSLYSGLVHDPASPGGPDHDFSAGSIFIRDTDSGGAVTEGAFRALHDWRITNESDPAVVPPSVLTYIGHAYDGSQDYGTGVIPGGDGLLDHKVTQTFHLAAGDYTVFAGGSDYASQLAAVKSLGVSGTLSVISAVPEPETYAMLLAGLGLVGALTRQRNTAGKPRE